MVCGAQRRSRYFRSRGEGGAWNQGKPIDLVPAGSNAFTLRRRIRIVEHNYFFAAMKTVDRNIRQAHPSPLMLQQRCPAIERP